MIFDLSNVRVVGDTEKEPPIPCLGHWTHTIDGSEHACGYDVDFVCEDCVVNGGRRDPRTEQEKP